MVERKKSEPVHTGPLTEAQRKLLPSVVSDIELIDDDIDKLKIDRAELLSAASMKGLDPKALNELIRRRKKSPDEAEQYRLFQDTVDLYAVAMAEGDVRRWSQADREKVAEAARSVARASMIDRPFAPPLDQPAGIPVIEELMQLGRKN